MSRSPVSWKAFSRFCAEAVTIFSATSRSSSESGWNSCEGARSPSNRKIGGRPTLRWISVAPPLTALLRTALRSMATSPPSAARALIFRRSDGGFGAEAAAGVAGGAGERLDHAQRRARGTPRCARVGDVAADQRLDHPPHGRDPRDPEDEPWKAVERDLRAPGRRGVRRERARERAGVGLERGGAAAEEVER